MIRVGMIGAGIIGHDHARALRIVNEVEFKAVADIVPARAKEFEEKYGARPYTDYKEMLKNEQLDAVVINLPHGLHKEAAIYSAYCGLHVFLEKPMANSVEECNSMLEAAEKNNVKLMIGHIQRFFAENIKAKELIHSGELGDLVMITDIRNIDYFTEKRPGWFFSKQLAGGGIVMNYGAHSLDKLIWLTELNIKNISGLASQHLPNYEVEGNAQMLVQLEGDISAVISYSGYKGPSFNETNIYMTKGVIKLCTGYGLWVSKGGEFEPVAIQKPKNSFELIWENFRDNINNNTNPEPDGYYGREIIRLIEETYQDSLKRKEL